jgi:hypothetical protein
MRKNVNWLHEFDDVHLQDRQSRIDVNPMHVVELPKDRSGSKCEASEFLGCR